MELVRKGVEKRSNEGVRCGSNEGGRGVERRGAGSERRGGEGADLIVITTATATASPSVGICVSHPHCCHRRRLLEKIDGRFQQALIGGERGEGG